MSQITLPRLAEEVGVTRRHLQRLAAQGDIPGATRTLGGHWRVEEGPALESWKLWMRMDEIRRTSLSRDHNAPIKALTGKVHRTLLAALKRYENSRTVPSEEFFALLQKLRETVDLALEDARGLEFAVRLNRAREKEVRKDPASAGRLEDLAEAMEDR